MIFAFALFYIVNVLACVIVGLLSDGGSISASLFGLNKTSDQFMDFFNSIRDSNHKNIYSTRHSIYPPLAALFFRLIGSMTDQDLVNTKFTGRKKFYSDQTSMMIFYLVVVICLLLMSKMIEDRLKNVKSRVFAKVLSITLVVTFPIFYCVERGNIVLMCVLTSMFFFFFRNSENKAIRELAYFSLAISAGLKLYPAIFGLVLIVERKFKDAIRLIIYGIICVGLPYMLIYMHDTGILRDLSTLCVNSLKLMNMSISPFTVKTTPAAIMSKSELASAAEIVQNIGYIFYNIRHFFLKKIGKLNFSSVSVQNFIYFPGLRKLIKSKAYVTELVLIVTEGFAALSLLLTKSEWKRCFLLCYLMLNIPAASSTYSISFITIPFVLFLADSKNTKKYDWVHLSFFSFMLVPIPIWWYFFYDDIKKWCTENKVTFDISFNKIFSFLFFQLLFVFIVITSIIEICVLIVKTARDKTYIIENIDDIELDIQPVLPVEDEMLMSYSMYNIDEPSILMPSYSAQQKLDRLSDRRKQRQLKKQNTEQKLAEERRLKRFSIRSDATKKYNYKTDDWSSIDEKDEE